ncbi:DUF1643 domain-containing protein [Bacillus sp. SCS-151]|uniref:DUF1643 domain-containing protein n=1 Tax=Nanhaiella sioensis TaxID=3115293 RepID=UPI00397D4906
MAYSYPIYVRPNIECDTNLLTSEISSRRCLTVPLNNKLNKTAVFIMMNPSKANSYESDKTINKCASICYHDLSHLKIGRFKVVNVYPFYQSNANQLVATISNVKNISRALYYEEILNNVSVVQDVVKTSDYVIMATGRIPDTINDKTEYQFILDTIGCYIETYKGKVYLSSGKSYNNRYYMEYAGNQYSYHLAPKGITSKIDRLKLFNISNGKFMSIPETNPIPLTVPPLL